jgi:hypothetical protein
VKNRNIANSSTTIEANKKINTDLESEEFIFFFFLMQLLLNNNKKQ